MSKWKISSAAKISISYLVIGVLWILFSDKILAAMIPQTDNLTQAQTTKGLFFVLVTTTALYNILLIGNKTEKNTKRKAEEQYRMLVEGLPGVVFMDNFNDPQTTHYMSPRLFDLLGYSPEEWQAGDNLWENSLHPDDKDRVIAEDKHTDHTGDPFRIEYRMRHRDGHYVWIKEDASLVRDKDGIARYWQGILLDITDQKLAEEALDRRDAILKAVGFSAEEFLKSIHWDENAYRALERLGITTEVSRAYIFKKEDMDTISHAFEWCQEGITPLWSDPSLRKFDLAGVGLVRWKKFFDQGVSVFGRRSDFPIHEQEFLNRQSIRSLICIPIQSENQWWGFIGFDDCTQERKWTEDEIEALRAVAQTLGIAIERKQSVTALLESETSYRGLFNTVRDAIYILDKNGVFLDINDGAVQMYGYSKQEVIGRTSEFLSAPGRNDPDEVNEAIRKAFEGIPQEFEFWGRRSTEEVFPMDVRLFMGNYFGKEVLIAISQDITARKQYEEALRKQLGELSILHTAAMTQSAANNMDELIQKVTDIISDNLRPDNCGVLLLHEIQNSLVPHYSYRGTDIQYIFDTLPASQGLYGKALEMRQPYRTGNVLKEPNYHEISVNTRSQLCVPIISGQRVFGVLNVESKQLDAFTQGDEKLLNTIAGGLANTMERIKLFDLERRRYLQAEILRQATVELTAFYELDKLFEKIFIILEKLIGFDSASLEMIHKDMFEIVAGRNIPADLIGKRYIANIEKWGGMDELRHPIIISDTQKDERFTKFEQTRYIRSWMGIPLLAQDKLVGFLNLDSRFPNFFNTDQAAIAQTFANQAAIAIENTRLFELEQRRRKEAETLNQATSFLANALDARELFERILDWLGQLVPYDSASIMMKSGNGDQIQLAAHRNLPEEFNIGQEFPLTPKWQIIGNSRKPLIIEDAQNDPIFEKWPGSEYIRGWMAIAMFAQDKLIGFINLDSRTPGTFEQEHASLVQTFANLAATTIERVRLYTETKQRLEELEMVSRVSFALRTARDTREMLPILLNEIQSILGTQEAGIWLYDGQQKLLIPQAVGGRLADLPKSIFASGEGIVGRVFANALPHLSQDFSKDTHAFPENIDVIGPGMSMFAVPIQTTADIIGVLVVGIRSPRFIEISQRRLISTIAEIAGNAIYRSTLSERSEEQIRRLLTLREMDTAIASSLDLRVTLNIITEHLVSKMGAGAAAILVFNPESQMLDYVAKQGFHRTEAPHASVSISEGVTGQILLSRKPVYIKDIERESPATKINNPSNERFASYFALPLFIKGAARGILETYFRQPFVPTSDWLDFIQTLAGQAAIAIDNSQLFESLQRSNQELSLAYDTTLEGWGKALELRDKETQGHTRRVTNLTVELARQMGVSEADLVHIRRGTLLHDIGKMGVPDNILHKPGPLTEEEKAEMQKHPQYAYDLLSPIPYLRPALDIAYYHHEWWDGSGYPNGINGEAIPLSARIFAVVDVWDALLSDRPYREAWQQSKVMEYIEGLSGKQFDPQVVAAFKKMLQTGKKFIRSNFPETPTAPESNEKTKKKR